jgi:hypothetical protein
MEYKLFTFLEGTRGLDTEVNLHLSIRRDTPPKWLGDFADGHATIFNGHGGQEDVHSVTRGKYEGWLTLTFQNGKCLDLVATFVHVTNPVEPLAPLEERPLAKGGRVSLRKSDYERFEYIISHANWW